MTTEKSELVDRLKNELGWGIGPALLCQEAADRILALEAENERLRALLTKPPKHKFWGAGESDCPRDIKAGNGELHTLRCKVCGIDSPKDNICRATLPTPSP